MRSTCIHLRALQPHPTQQLHVLIHKVYTSNTTGYKNIHIIKLVTFNSTYQHFISHKYQQWILCTLFTWKFFVIIWKLLTILIFCPHVRLHWRGITVDVQQLVPNEQGQDQHPLACHQPKTAYDSKIPIQVGNDYVMSTRWATGNRYIHGNMSPKLHRAALQLSARFAVTAISHKANLAVSGCFTGPVMTGKERKERKWTCTAPSSVTRPLSAQMWITQSYLQIHICLAMLC